MTRYLFPLLTTLMATSTAWADWETNMPVGVTDLSAETYDLHMTVFWVCTVIAVMVFGTIPYGSIRPK